MPGHLPGLGLIFFLSCYASCVQHASPSSTVSLSHSLSLGSAAPLFKIVCDSSHMLLRKGKNKKGPAMLPVCNMLLPVPPFHFHTPCHSARLLLNLSASCPWP
ncbi:hypothetical protein L195_g017195 [Trifolium pratense]|uniref:Secreted protein n=1 Tax=Trifolium pratense TaxID=57577 RepID=A0A2K3MT83_TRIPR|nr:hypothetical protein L195_g017195 [Trifolium pratense]